MQVNGGSPTGVVTHHCFNTTHSDGNSIDVDHPNDGLFHTYGVRVMPMSVTYFFDGSEIATSASGTALCTNDDYHVVLDIETVAVDESGFESAMTASAEAATLVVDYVRAWDFQDNCPTINEFFFPQREGRLDNSNQFKVGTGLKSVTLEECMLGCERLNECESVEFLERTGRCLFRNSTSRLQGLRRYSNVDDWYTSDRRARRCSDLTCQCETFQIATDAPTLVPATRSPTAQPTTAAPTASCIDTLSNQFELFSEFKVLKQHARYNLESPAKLVVKDLAECMRRCVWFGDGKTCLGVQYSNRTNLPLCLLKSVRPVAKLTGPDQALTKGSARFDLYSRHSVCTESVPEGICAVQHPLNLFSVTTRTRRQLSVPNLKAETATDCARRCLAEQNPTCMSFSHTSWKGCFLYGDDTTSPLISKNSHTFYERNMDTFCDTELGSTEIGGLMFQESSVSAGVQGTTGVTWAPVLVVGGICAAVGLVLARRTFRARYELQSDQDGSDNLVTETTGLLA